MALKRVEKQKQVEDIKKKFGRAQAAFIAEYKGVKAMGMNEIRNSLRAASVELKVVRNTLAIRAVKGTAAEPLALHLKGAAAIIFSYKDAVLAAKKLMGFASEQPNLKLRAGLLGDKLIGLKEIKSLSELPSRDVLLGNYGHAQYACVKVCIRARRRFEEVHLRAQRHQGKEGMTRRAVFGRIRQGI